MSSHQIEELKRYIDEKLDPAIEKVEIMYKAYTTVQQGSVWVKYAFWFIGSIIGAGLALREFFKH